MTMLTVEALSVTLGTRQILRDVSLSIRGGELIGLIGPNGAGKSTLIKGILGLLPASGNVLIDGQPVTSLEGAERARQMSYLPQDRDVAWQLTAAKVVELGRTPYLQPMRGPTEIDAAKVAEAMGEADVLPLRDRPLSELSGGERARVLIARALAQDTPVFLADEPTAGLDPAHQISLMRVLSQLAQRGRIVVASLHELSLAARWCTRLILLDGGSIAADGAPEVVLTEQNLAAVYGISAYLRHGENGLIVQPLDTIAMA
ncbi:ABC transporter ATP-binding protein [Hyphomicrobium sp.]|uniref:ABC transporter ATP-binding protein n=1 Tax=Hyphomicrobium sp. TaxID=82 RepID=UPI002E37BECA|nr:ABC transporter ATP-binding protein [Hyphomicrobium sp.]HEX2842970.1 ABC transporter ATP-binding protein [Hyphomicrobium sp.]